MQQSVVALSRPVSIGKGYYWPVLRALRTKTSSGAALHTGDRQVESTCGSPRAAMVARKPASEACPTPRSQIRGPHGWGLPAPAAATVAAPA